MSAVNSSSNILGRLWVERLVGGSITGFGIIVGGGEVVVGVTVVIAIVGFVVGATVEVAASVIKHILSIIMLPF